MKKIRVYLQYPWRFPDSPYYKSLIERPPKEVEFFNASNQKGVITKKGKFALSNKLKRSIRKSFNIFRMSIPNAHLTLPGNYGLIHCAHCLSKNTDKPWVADIESPWQIYIGDKTVRAKKRVKGILLYDNCKKILPWTKTTMNELLKDFPEVKDKMEVIYPAIPERKIRKTHLDGKITLIFSARYFFQKGGLHALEAIDKLTKKYENVYGIINSEVPEDIMREYVRNRKLSFFSLVPQKKLFELYASSDIMVYPGYSDSFGFAYLEAMSFGIPVVTFDGYARKEIVEDKKTGFVIELPGIVHFEKFVRLSDKNLVDSLVEKSSLLIENKLLREKMSRNCLREIREGKFSVKVRNKKLKKIYEEALK